MIALTIIISTKLTVTLQDEAHKLLQTESVRLANRVQGAVDRLLQYWNLLVALWNQSWLMKRRKY